MKNVNEEELYEVDYLEKIPSWIVRWGNTVIALFLITLILGSHFFSFNTIVTTDMEMLSNSNCKTGFESVLKIPFKDKDKIKVNQQVLLKLYDFPFEEYGYLNGKIIELANSSIDKNGAYIIGHVYIDSMVTTRNKRITAESKMLGSVDILVEELSILQRVFYHFRGLWDPS